ncbi:hypothetical protein C9397_05085 [Xanthomonas vasicola pv. vasculorum]|uniref:Uncharacterized protein n=2 Tax=Xanthomonas vasicola TaxID=56459 RepID=A0AAE8JWY5_XANVA|nr:hypothetical protein C7V42_15220 [Xanthomonas vasicola pv. vasculorum]AZR22282.1 hypothetical protein NX81_008010 [Xanthomonas vasicola]AZR26612.1 hypothetical protein NX80_009070 [Xanthomonas vasicola pv. arecae]RRJ39201.1 hypothetical protein EIM46_13085 [Xanthomonas vasicola pv. musacearum]AZM71957.1 hypothetical protein CXP37_15235 [Xanthomonas vasicola pv. vasculorum]
MLTACAFVLDKRFENAAYVARRAPLPTRFSSPRRLDAAIAHALHKRAAATLYVSSPCASDNVALTQHRVFH